MLRTCIGLAALWLLVGCAATSYHPLDSTGGYKEIRLGERLYQVTFRANSFTSPEEVYAYLLYRAAEVAQRDGAPRFTVWRQRIAAAVSRPGLLPTDQSSTSITIELLPGGMGTDSQPETYSVEDLLTRLPQEFPALSPVKADHTAAR